MAQTSSVKSDQLGDYTITPGTQADSSADSSIVPLDTLSAATTGTSSSAITFAAEASVSPAATGTRGHHIIPWSIDPKNNPDWEGQVDNRSYNVDSLKVVINGTPDYYRMHPFGDPLPNVYWLDARDDINPIIDLTPGAKISVYEHMTARPGLAAHWEQIGDTRTYTHINKGVSDLAPFMRADGSDTVWLTFKAY